jgi:hypothetical protein
MHNIGYDAGWFQTGEHVSNPQPDDEYATGYPRVKVKPVHSRDDIRHLRSLGFSFKNETNVLGWTKSLGIKRGMTGSCGIIRDMLTFSTHPMSGGSTVVHHLACRPNSEEN